METQCVYCRVGSESLEYKNYVLQDGLVAGLLVQGVPCVSSVLQQMLCLNPKSTLYRVLVALPTLTHNISSNLVPAAF